MILAVYRLSALAEADIMAILARTGEAHGDAARIRYEALIAAGLRDVAADPLRPGSRAWPKIGNAIRTYHLRHARARAKSAGRVRTPRHLLLYRCASADLVGVGRVLHEAMDISRHVPAEYGDEN